MVTKWAATILFVSACFLPITKVAAIGPEDDDMIRGRPTFQQSGQLFTVQFTPEDRSLSVKFAGDRLATVDPEKISLFGKVYPRKGKPRDLTIVLNQGSYQISDERYAPTDEVELKIKDKKTNKTEVHRITPNKQKEQ